jgi:hypothetical protein
MMLVCCRNWPSLYEQSRKTLSDKACDVVAVQLVVFDCVHALLEVLGVLGVVSHAVAHPFGDVPDDVLVSILDGAEFPADHIKFDQQLAILLVGSVLGEIPSRIINDLVERAQQWLFLGQGNGHVILDRVQSSEDQVEQADGYEQLRV